MAALQVVPISGGAVPQSPVQSGAIALSPAPYPLTLYAIEEQLTAMADTAELVPEEQEQTFLEEFRAALTAAVDKRDRVGQFLAHLEQQAAFVKAEIARLQERKVFFERAVEKMESYVIHVIESIGPASGAFER